ncbi:nuclear receptor coactivator 7 isoform X3 [Xenopus tropicalis]|uniref:Nuclear receptor coactivator 7 isoform X3 n=1 Tax=Xenopus tropicalis TaxID=8364 RepID=A0A8J1JJ11_XENTR|nr:nuclear receptor coactivator 7 isoform X3 [Xenopus tropicalis]
MRMFAVECMQDTHYCSMCPVRTDTSLELQRSEASEPLSTCAPRGLYSSGHVCICSPSMKALDTFLAPLSKKSYYWSIDCSQLPYFVPGENQNNKNVKKEKKMVTRRPLGTIEYTATGTDTLNSIALKFNLTPNKLVELNKLFTHTIVPGQILYVPDSSVASIARDPKANAGILASPLSSDAEYDKLPDADLARKASKPIERVLSSTSEEEEPADVKFIKMNCRYITDGKGVVGGVMIVTPNNVMFDPHKSDPLVIENGCEEYGLICPMEEVVSVALYNDISHMKIKDALPSPGEWEDLSSEKDINPFSKFKNLSKEKRQQNGVSGQSIAENKLITTSSKDLDLIKITTELEPKNGSDGQLSPVQLTVDERLAIQTDQSIENITSSRTKKADNSPVEDDFIELVATTAEANCKNNYKESENPTVVGEAIEHSMFQNDIPCNNSESNRTVDVICPVEQISDPVKRICLVSDKTETTSDSDFIQTLQQSKNIELCLSPAEKNKLDICGFQRSDLDNSGDEGKVMSCINLEPKNITEVTTVTQNVENKLSKPEEKASEESVDSLSPSSPEVPSQKETLMDSESELKLWLIKRMQRPIEDLFPSKEEKSKIPPMFLCIRVGKPMRKSFASQSTAVVQQYIRRRKQPEYWFAVPQERVDHLYNFFVQWSPEVYGKDAKEQGFVVVEKDELNMIDNFFSEPSTKSWEIITVEEAKRRKSTCSCYDDDEDEEETLEDFLPDLKQKSVLLDDMQVEKLAHNLPARVQGYLWHLVYSTQEHGTSLKTLYRNLATVDSPVLLVVKDMDNQVFGAYATHPFRLSDHYYGTGETFLYTFCPDFKVYKWSGENSYFINGDISFLGLGGGGGRFGLWLDSDLYHGRSNACCTFNNDTMSKKEDFIVQDIEVWAFE